MSWNELLVLLGFLAVSFVAASSGAFFKPGAWYDSLAKPWWTPPKWAFPVVWSALYVMMAVAAWRVWLAVGFAAAKTAFVIYLVQLAINAGWSAVFFGLKRMDWGMAELVALWIGVAATIIAFAPYDTVAAWLLAPYLLWVTIAGALNLAMIRLNPSSRAVTQP
jgi:tryptophan-rich sensory protein